MKYTWPGVPCGGTAETNPTRNHEVAGSDPALLWLWRRPAATAPIGPLAWEPPCAAGAAQEIAKTTTTTTKDKKKKKVLKITVTVLKMDSKKQGWIQETSGYLWRYLGRDPYSSGKELVDMVSRDWNTNLF